MVSIFYTCCSQTFHNISFLKFDNFSNDGLITKCFIEIDLKENYQDKSFMRNMILHCADLGNSLKNWEAC